MMRSTVAAVAGATMMVMTLFAVPSAQAQLPHDDRAFFTFSSPVAVPGATLPPGNYVFRLVDPDSSRGVVQVMGTEGTVYGLFFTQRIMRPTPPAAAEIALGEAPVGQARSISSWWQPGELFGRSFVYRPGEASWERETPMARNSD